MIFFQHCRSLQTSSRWNKHLNGVSAYSAITHEDGNARTISKSCSSLCVVVRFGYTYAKDRWIGSVSINYVSQYCVSLHCVIWIIVLTTCLFVKDMFTRVSILIAAPLLALIYTRWLYNLCLFLEVISFDYFECACDVFESIFLEFNSGFGLYYIVEM